LAAVCGSTPWVFAPSVSTTMTSAAYAPPAGSPGTSTPVGETDGSMSAIASIEVRIACPIAVPREVVRSGSAASSAAVSVVGGTRRPAIPPKATSPIRAPPGCALMNSAAAFSAAVSRLGCTSVEHIDPDTSSASRIVVELDGTATVACGRAAPSPSTASPSSSRAAGTRRRHRVRPGRAARTSAAEVTRTADRRRRRRVHHATPSTSGTASSASRAAGQANDIRPASPSAAR